MVDDGDGAQWRGIGPGGTPDVPLGELEETVQQAMHSGDDSDLSVLGFGEISLVLGWPADRPVAACKRLPPFTDEADAAAYGERFVEYLEVLTARGVEPVSSSLHRLPADGGVVAYVVQPVLDAADLGPEVLRRDVPDPEHPLVAGIVEAVVGVTDERTGLDAQVSNWTISEGRLRYLDVTTPMLFGPDGRPTLDLGVFLAAYPWALRGAIGRFVAPGVIGSYRDPRHVLVDLAGNLLKERLEEWIPAVIEAANAVVGRPIDADEVRRNYRSDARLWEAMLRLRRADRWWQRTVRRRDYPFLLPGRIER